MDLLDAPGFTLARWAIPRGLGAAYLIEFLVAANQFRPLAERTVCCHSGRSSSACHSAPPPASSTSRGPSDRAIGAAAWSGAALALVAVTGLSDAFGPLVSIVVWTALWALYLSFVNAGQLFYGYGWETLLLDRLLAIFLGSSDVTPTRVTIWLFRWLLFRVTFGAGLIKLRGDPAERRTSGHWWHREEAEIFLPPVARNGSV